MFDERILGIPWSIVALVAIAIAVAYLFIDTSGVATGWQWIVLRWFHSLCWLLLAAGALAMTRITPLPSEWAMPLAAAGGLTYLVFIALSVSR